MYKDVFLQKLHLINKQVNWLLYGIFKLSNNFETKNSPDVGLSSDVLILDVWFCILKYNFWLNSSRGIKNFEQLLIERYNFIIIIITFISK